MTESQWQTCADPAPMLAFLRRRARERKLRLFAVACSHRILQDASPRAQAVAGGAGEGGWSAQRQREADLACQDSKQRESQVQAEMVREIFGNPFHSLSIDPTWLRWNDATVPRLARVIY